MKIRAAIFFCCLAALLRAQAPDIAWQRLIGGNYGDDLHDVLLLEDGGYLMTGGSGSDISGDKTLVPFGGGPGSGGDIWLVRLDQDRNILWQTEYGGAGSAENLITDYGIATLPSGDGFLVAGGSNTQPSGNKTEYCRGGLDYWLIRIDAAGNPLWQKAYGGSQDDYLRSFIATSDGNFILAGYSSSPISGEKSEDSRGDIDGWVIKIDPLGNILWQRTIGGSGWDRLNSARATSDGGAILSLTSDSPVSGEKSEDSYGMRDYWILKLDASGTISWQKTIGGSGQDALYDTFPTSDGGYLASGTSHSPISGLRTEPGYGYSDVWTLKLDGQGDIIWQKSIGGDYGNGAIKGIEIYGKGFLLGCSTTSGISGNKTVGFFGGIADCWLVRLNETGDILWQKELGGSGYEQGYQQIQTAPDGGILFSGTTDSSNSGNIDQTSNGSNDYWLLKLNPEELATNANLSTSFSVWPNPTTSVVNVRFPDSQEKVSVSVYDALGRLVSDGKYEDVAAINGLALGDAAGLYLVKVETGSSIETVKVIKK